MSFAAVLISLLALLSDARMALGQTPSGGIIGKDDRRIIDSLDPPWNAVGRVNIGGYRRTRHCTGTLIAPRLVVTAAHCLMRPTTGAPERPANIHFLAGVRQGKYLAHAKAACVHFLSGHRESATSPRARADRDAAIIVLEKDVAIPPAPLLRGLAPGEKPALVHASHQRDRPQVLSADMDCHLSEQVGDLWLTDCDTYAGGSGGPVFVQAGGKLSLAAVMIGFMKDKRSVALPISAWAELVEKAGCE